MEKAIVPDPQAVLARIREAVRLLAAPAEIQIASQPKEILASDEMALEFGDAWTLRPMVIEAGLVTTSQEEALNYLDRLLDEMSGPAQAWLWEDDALRTRPEWERVRRAAAIALEALDGKRLPG